MTIVYDKILSDDKFTVLFTYNSGSSSSSIADCTSVCEKEGECVYTLFYDGVCSYNRLINGNVKAAINGLPVYDFPGVTYAIKQ